MRVICAAPVSTDVRPLNAMNKETTALLVLPPVFMALGMAVHVIWDVVLDPLSLNVLWVLVALAITATLICVVRATTLLRQHRPLGYICCAAAILYIVLLVIMCTPGKTRMAAQQTGCRQGRDRAFVDSRTPLPRPA
jgi:hypothetical protein